MGFLEILQDISYALQKEVDVVAIGNLDHKKLIQVMKIKRLTQEEVAEEIGITDRHIRNLRKRDFDVSSSLLYKLSRTFQIPMEALLVLQEDTE